MPFGSTMGHWNGVGVRVAVGVGVGGTGPRAMNGKKNLKLEGGALVGMAFVAVAACDASSSMSVVLTICVTPDGNGFATVTTNWTLPDPPAMSVPTLRVQTVPALLPFGQLQPVPPVNVVLTGTVSVRTTPVASTLPVLV